MSKADFATLLTLCKDLNLHLTLRSYVDGYDLSTADVVLWAAIRGNKAGKSVLSQISGNLDRWYQFLETSQGGWIAASVETFTFNVLKIKNAKSKEGASYDLDGVEGTGPLVTRFPPEPSGYLHIGHGKAALLNNYFAHRHPGGTLICRFDDTNPSKESLEYQDSILQDLAMVEIRPEKTTYSSDYFKDMYELAIKLIKDGKAFADDSELGKGDLDRKNRLPSARRDLSIDETLQPFAEMKTGSVEGQRWCIRARIAYDSLNGTMRDPVVYRCNMTPHHRTGSEWKIYPTYDFCAPVLDSIEGITLALRTNEYRDRNEQYEWFQEALDLRKVKIWDFSRMNFVRTVLSKRKLAKIVALDMVRGWDDPRMPTIRGILRRGLTVAAFREFILAQGPSRNILNLEWGAFWALNKKQIDPVAPRHVAIACADAVNCTVLGVSKSSTAQQPNHAKNPSIGTKTVMYDSSIVLEQADALSFDQDEEITLMNWGNAFVRRIEKDEGGSKITSLTLELHLDGDVKKTKKKVTWLASSPGNMTKCQLFSFDYLITKDKLEKTDNLEDFLTSVTEYKTEAWADCNVSSLAVGNVIQFERKGFYRLDATSSFPDGQMAFFEVPTGKKDD